jgi:tRNA modification GTPase
MVIPEITHPADTIAAPVTPLRKSGVILVRISGNILPALSFFEIKKELKPNTPVLALYRSRSEPLISDRVLLTYFKSPKSYTGEDVLEVSFHGNPIIAEAALRDFLSVGIRYAERGEFTRRAVLYNKMTLAQAEAVERLADARTPRGVEKAGAALAGELDGALNLIYQRLVEVISDIEAGIDFAEDTADETDAYMNYTDNLKKIHSDLKRYANRYRNSKRALEGDKVVIAGKVNAGKSTLFNYLVGEDASIVTEEEGTTRDIITRTAALNGIDFIISDTAGLRQTESSAEKEGVRRALESLNTADLVLWVVSPDDKDAVSTPQENVITIGSKADIFPSGEGRFDIAVSAKTGFGMDKLTELIQKRLIADVAEKEIDLITDRQYEEVLAALKELENALSAETPDIAAFCLNRVCNGIKRIEGEAVSEAVLDRIFSRFCIGK